MIRLGVIGTACRDLPEQKRITKDHFDWMIDTVEIYIEQVLETTPDNIILVSGGSAWADHVAVKLYLTGRFAGLHLYLPSEFNHKTKLYKNTHEGRRLNELHQICSATTGYDTLNEIFLATYGKDKAKVTVQRGFGPRNTLIAKGSDHLIAFTFNDAEIPKEGGTMDTWKKFNGDACHFNLGLADKNN